jgi:hypothetical protein
MNELNMNDITQIPKVVLPTVPTIPIINIDKSVFWAFIVGLFIGTISNDKPKRIEITIS